MTNTIDALGDLVTFGSLAAKTITEFRDDRISFVPQNAFAYCVNLSYVNLPNASYVASSAFYSCTYLTEAWLDSCSSIGGSAFAATMLSRLYLNSTAVVSLANSMFSMSKSTTFYVRPELVDAYSVARYWSNIKSQIKPFDFVNNVPL